MESRETGNIAIGYKTKHSIICDEHHYTQTNTNTGNKARTNGG